MTNTNHPKKCSLPNFDRLTLCNRVCVSIVFIHQRSRMRWFRTYGSVRGSPSNGLPYSNSNSSVTDCVYMGSSCWHPTNSVSSVKWRWGMILHAHDCGNALVRIFADDNDYATNEFFASGQSHDRTRAVVRTES
jgi:hypothetical protein